MSQLINISNACPASNLQQKKQEHDRLSVHYFNLQPGTCLDHHEVERQRQELNAYYDKKRRTLLVKLLNALQLGADFHFEEQKKILWKEYHDEFLPHLLHAMHHIIIDNARILFSTDPQEGSQMFFSKQAGTGEGSLHESISISVAVYLEESKKRVLKATDEQCALLAVKSMNIMSKTILDIEDHWRQKTIRDVESFHLLKMQEMTYKLDEERDVRSAHWSVVLDSPQHVRRARTRTRKTRRKEGEEEGEEEEQSVSADHDKYYQQAQRCVSLSSAPHTVVFTSSPHIPLQLFNIISFLVINAIVWFICLSSALHQPVACGRLSVRPSHLPMPMHLTCHHQRQAMHL